ncbi:MAG: RnfABCDGE type electron transport complex subunit G [Deltaproteobacteria bacterium]|nr:RnfABCDGE type electron transport complex subunit G [Deltaproteobacteria bacterium]
MRDLIRMVVVLTAICAGSALVLSYTNQATKNQREYQITKYVRGPSVIAVLGDFDNDPLKDVVKIDMGKDDKGRIVEKDIFVAKRDNKPVSMAYESVSDKGYSGLINVMVGLDTEGKVIGVAVMTHSETPGKGSLVEEQDFRDQFKGLQVPQDVKLSGAGGKIDAISGATVSSRAVAEAVAKALELFPRVIKEVML